MKDKGRRKQFLNIDLVLKQYNKFNKTIKLVLSFKYFLHYSANNKMSFILNFLYEFLNILFNYFLTFLTNLQFLFLTPFFLRIFFPFSFSPSKKGKKYITHNNNFFVEIKKFVKKWRVIVLSSSSSSFSVLFFFFLRNPYLGNLLVDLYVRMCVYRKVYRAVRIRKKGCVFGKSQKILTKE